MTQKDPELKDNEIHFNVDNVVIYEMIQANYSDEILAHLRQNLNNWSIHLKLGIVQSKDESQTYLSGKDKFERLLQKNNNLLSLKKIFNLDVEY